MNEVKVLLAIAGVADSQGVVLSEEALKNVASKHENFLFEDGRLYAIGNIKINLMESKESK